MHDSPDLVHICELQVHVKALNELRNEIGSHVVPTSLGTKALKERRKEIGSHVVPTSSGTKADRG
jgi:hypothetical protein